MGLHTEALQASCRLLQTDDRPSWLPPRPPWPRKTRPLLLLLLLLHRQAVGSCMERLRRFSRAEVHLLYQRIDEAFQVQLRGREMRWNAHPPTGCIIRASDVGGRETQPMQQAATAAAA